MLCLDVFLDGELIASAALDGPVVVGRGEDVDLRLPDPAVSRRHATFRPDPSSAKPRAILRDEGSTNGSAVNGEILRSAESPVGPGDEIHIGPFRFCLRLEGQSDRDSPEFAEMGTAVLANPLAPWRTIPVERLSALYELARVELPADVDALAEAAAGALRATLSYSVLAFSLDRDGGPPAEAVWTPEGPRDLGADLVEPEVLELFRSSRRAVVVPAGEETRPRVLDAEGSFDGRAAILCIPLESPGGEALGVVYLESGEGSPYGASDIEFAFLVANAIGASLGRRRIEDALRKAKEAAEASDRAKTRFLANMSHELRTPLHAILSFARFGIAKIESASKEKLLDYFREIEKSGGELLALLNQLLDLASLETQELEYALGSSDLAAIVEEVLAALEAGLWERGASIRFARPHFAATLEADAGRIAQVVEEVLSNAVKFGGAGSRADVTIEETSVRTSSGSVPGLLLSVADEGVGIPDDELESIFKKFAQSSRTASGAGGRGLGLAAARAIVAAHGGWIAARNRADRRGAIFEIALPRVPPKTAPCRRGAVPRSDTADLPEVASRSR